MCVIDDGPIMNIAHGHRHSVTFLFYFNVFFIVFRERELGRETSVYCLLHTSFWGWSLCVP